jgi:hypothetical protein
VIITSSKQKNCGAREEPAGCKRAVSLGTSVCDISKQLLKTGEAPSKLDEGLPLSSLPAETQEAL